MYRKNRNELKIKKSEEKLTVGKKTRGRPRDFNHEVALERALEVFWSQGFEVTSISELTAAMGISAASLYGTFGNKEELFWKSVDLYKNKYAVSIEQCLQEETSAKAAIHRILNEVVIAYTSPATPPGCLIVSGAVNSSPASSDVEKALRRRRVFSEEIMREKIEKGIANKELPANTNAAALSKFYAAVIQGMSLQSQDGCSRKELQSIADQAMQVWPQ